jgi:ring-1,2-phenylacetyl-CoA epoxidase subunit PaaB
MIIKSLDPRITRAGISRDETVPFSPLEPLDQLETYEVFHQQVRGGQPIHVGSVHAPNPEIAMLFAKEQYARRYKCVGLWVVRTSDVHTLGVEDEDIFETTPEKKYRDASGYRVGGKIREFKKEQERRI